MYSMLGNGPQFMDKGYSYYGEVRLGHSFILGILDYVMGHICTVC